MEAVVRTRGSQVFCYCKIEQREARRMWWKGMIAAKILIHAGEGIADMLQSLGQCGLHRSQGFLYRRVSVDPAGNWQHVDEIADKLSLVGRLAGRRHRSEEELRSSAASESF